MPLDLDKVSAAYDVLEEKAIKTLDRLVQGYQLDEREKGKVISNTINTLIVKSVDSIQQQQISDMQIAEIDARIDLLLEQTQTENRKNEAGGLIDSQISEINANITRENNKATSFIEKNTQDKLLVIEQIKSEQKRNMVGGLIDKDISIKTSQYLLIDRQFDAYDDNLRIEEAKQFGNVLSMYAVSGNVTTTDIMNTTLLNLVNAITK